MGKRNLEGYEINVLEYVERGLAEEIYARVRRGNRCNNFDHLIN